MPGFTKDKLQFEFSLALERSSPDRDFYLNNTRSNSMKYDQQKDQITVTKSIRVDQGLLLPEQDSLDIKIQQALRHPAIRDTKINLISHNQSRPRRDALDLNFHQSPFTVLGRPSQTWGFQFNLGWRREGNNFLHASDDEILTLIRRLKIVFSRMPDMTFPKVEPRQRFIRSVINHLIRHSYQSFQAKAEIQTLPSFEVHRNGSSGLRCNIRLNGYDFTQPDPGNASYTVDSYTLVMSLPVGRVRSEPVVIPYEEKYVWTPSAWGGATRRSDELARRLEETHDSSSSEEQLRTYRLAQQIQVTFDGYVGPKCYAQWIFSQLRDKNTDVGRRHGIYNGDGMIWIITVNKYSSYIRPSKLEMFYP